MQERASCSVSKSSAGRADVSAMFCNNEEINAIENWKGLAYQSPSHRKRKSYLEPNAEVMHISLDPHITHKNATIGILRNGNLDQLKPFQFGDMHVVLSNTCAFDTLVQLAATTYCDSVVFKNRIFESAENSEICRLIALLVHKKVHREIYQSRANILHNIFQSVQQFQSTYLLNTESTITHMLSKIWPFPSYHELHSCSQSDCANSKATESTFISVDLFNINDINTVIASKITVPESHKCFSCQHPMAVAKTIDPISFFIEPVNITEKSLEFTVILNSLPTVVTINNSKYILRGVIGFQGPTCQNKKSLGHFVTYSLRYNKKWEIYNDLNEKVHDCSEYKQVRVQLLFYSR